MLVVVICFWRLWTGVLRPGFEKQAISNIEATCGAIIEDFKRFSSFSDLLLYDHDSKINTAIKEIEPGLDAELFRQYSDIVNNGLETFTPFEPLGLLDTKTSKALLRTYIITRSGLIFSRNDSSGLGLESHIDYIIRKTDRITSENHGKLYLYYEPAFPNILFAVRKVYSWHGAVSFPDVDKQIATFIAELDIQSLFSGLDSKDDTICYVVQNTEGQNMYVSSNPEHFPLELINGVAGSKREGSYLAYAIDTGRSDIRIAALLDETGLASEVYQSLLMTGFIFAGLIVVIILLMVAVSYGVRSEFRTLINSMNQTTVLNRSAQLPVEADDEVGRLTEVYNQMLERVSALNERVQERDVLLKSAELSAFQSQINPHFLYNTLDCISGMIELHKDVEAQKMIAALGSIMRMAIKGPDMLPVREDMVYVEQYLYIQKMRRRENQFLIEVSEGIKDYLIPKLIVQPCIENAIIHGVAPKLGQGMVSIRGYEKNGMIEFLIQDNGVGMPEEIVREINAPIDMENSKALPASERIGLRNIKRRLELIYDGHASIHVVSAPESGTSVVISFPTTKGE